MIKSKALKILSFIFLILVIKLFISCAISDLHTKKLDAKKNAQVEKNQYASIYIKPSGDMQSPYSWLEQVFKNKTKILFGVDEYKLDNNNIWILPYIQENTLENIQAQKDKQDSQKYYLITESKQDTGFSCCIISDIQDLKNKILREHNIVTKKFWDLYFWIDKLKSFFSSKPKQFISPIDKVDVQFLTDSSNKQTFLLIIHQKNSPKEISTKNQLFNFIIDKKVNQKNQKSATAVNVYIFNDANIIPKKKWQVNISKNKDINSKIEDLKLYFFKTKQDCKNSNPILEKTYFSVENINQLELDYPLWSKLVKDNNDISYCSEGRIINNKIDFSFYPILFNSDRTAVIVLNSKDLSRLTDNRSDDNLWESLYAMLEKANERQNPVDLYVINEDRRLQLIMRAEEMFQMKRSHNKNQKKYPKVWGRISDMVTLNHTMSNPMALLEKIYYHYKFKKNQKLKKIIYITGSKYIPEKPEDLTPDHKKMPLYWRDMDISFIVFSDCKKDVWEEAKVNKFINFSKISTLYKWIK